MSPDDNVGLDAPSMVSCPHYLGKLCKIMDKFRSTHQASARTVFFFLQTYIHIVHSLCTNNFTFKFFSMLKSLHVTYRKVAWLTECPSDLRKVGFYLLAGLLAQNVLYHGRLGFMSNDLDSSANQTIF